MAVILEEQTLEFAPNASFGGIYHCNMSFTDESFEIGREYIVIWDGTMYRCTATKMALGDMTGEAIGNGALFGIAEDTGEPFLIGYFPGDKSSAVVTDSTDTTHTITIYTEEEAVGVSIVLYDRTGAAVKYENVETITTDTPDAEQGATFTYGVIVENAEYEPDFVNGNQKVTLEKGQLLKEFTVVKPEKLLPEYIKKNVEVAGVVGEFAGDEVEKTIDLNMSEGDQVIEADADTVMKKVTVVKPKTLIPENVLEGVDIAGIVGIHKDDILVEDMEIILDMSEGDQILTATEGYAVKSAIIKKPDTLIPENIAQGIDIGGVVGTLESGSGGESEDKVTFFDYNGEIVAEYPISAIPNLTELPAPPEHEGLTFQGWNYTLEEIKNEIAIMQTILHVGATYITSDGKTKLYLNIDNLKMRSITLLFSQTMANGVSVDWGDGGDTVTTNSTGNVTLTHEYAELGNYVISLDVADGCTFGFGQNSNTKQILGNYQNDPVNILKKVEIGKNITTISNYAFYGSNSLETISIPKGVTSIGNSVFTLCYTLNALSIPKGVTSLGGNVLQNALSLIIVSIPNGITQTSTYMFDNCVSLKELVFPLDSVEYGSYSVEKAINLKTLVNCIPATGTHNISLKKLVYKRNITALPDYFSGATNCLEPENIVYPINLTSFGNYAFSNKTKFKKFDVPEGIESIGTSCFSDCKAIEKITLPSTLKSIGASSFSNCYHLKKMIIPNGVTEIPNSLFNACWSLENVEIPEGVTSIGNTVFTNCYSLRKLTFPSTLTTIGSKILSYMYNLREIHFLSKTPPTISDKLVNYGNITKCTIYVPKGTLATYQSATNLSTYASQMVEE